MGSWLESRLTVLRAEPITRIRSAIWADEAPVLARATVNPDLRPDALAIVGRLGARGVPHRDVSIWYALLGEDESAIRLLVEMHEAGAPDLPNTITGPAFDSIRDDPRIIAILTDLDLPLRFDQ